MALAAAGLVVPVLAIAVPGERWTLAATAVVPAAVAVRALLLGVEVRGETVVVRNLLRTTRVPITEVEDVVVEEIGVQRRMRAALRMRSGFDVPIDALHAGYDVTSRRRLHEEVADLRRRVEAMRRGGEI